MISSDSSGGGAHPQGPAARRTALAERVLAEGSASAAQLAEHFGVSLMTIHRDLDELELQGVVRKFRGGVTAQPSGVFESNVQYRLKEKDGGTLIELRHTALGLIADEHRAGVVKGWKHMLELAKKIAERKVQ